MILRVVTGRALTADGVEQRFFEHGQMADVVDGHQVLGRIVGLEVADARVLGRFLKQGLVAVGKRRAALGQRFAHAIDGMRREHVVVVGKGQILTRCELRGLVRIGGNALVLDFGVDDALVLRGAGADCLAHVGVRVVGGVHQNQLPVRRGLGLHAVQKLLQKLRRCVVQRR